MTKEEYTRRLDKLVSLIVRKSEHRCYTCGRRLVWNKRQCGHFIPRYVLATRWDLHNCHVQCANCNVDLAGNIWEYKQKLQQRLGRQALDYLEDVYKDYKNGRGHSPSLQDLKTLYTKYVKHAREFEESPGDYIPLSWD